MEMFEAGAIVWRGHDVAGSDGHEGGTHWWRARAKAQILR